MKSIFCLCLIAFLSCNKAADNTSGSEALHGRAVGASANEILSAQKYSAIKLEVQYMPGFAPDPAALNHLQQFLNTYCNKPGGVTIVTREIPAAGSTTLSASDVSGIEKNQRSLFTAGSEIALYILYTNGNYTDNNVLGIAYRNTSAALFGKKIRDNSGGIGQPSRTKLEATVLEHELAHLMGLVDIGSPMQTPHKDPANGSHCNNSNCLMYYASETSDVLGMLVTGNIPVLDAACVADLRANGGK